MGIKKLNNQGSTLLTVIIILAFIGILGSMMLSVTMTNLQMKMIERKAKENFYTCETALDEIRTGLHALTVQKISEIYDSEILSDMATYISYTEEALNNELKDKVSIALVEELGDTSGISDLELQNGTLVEEKDSQIFDEYLTPLPEGGDIVRNISIGTISVIPQKGIIISEIDVNMTLKEFTSRICTDIVIELPNFSFTDGLQTIVYRMNQPYNDYALVADGEIISSNSFGEGSSGINTINGSIYGGNGITIDGQNMSYHSVIINGGNIVTREDITVMDNGGLEINSITVNDPVTGLPISVPAMVWANNIRTLSSTFNPAYTIPTTIDIDGICLIRDDLTLDGTYSNVVLKGAYVGYTGTRSSLGSSIIVNGNGSSLDLSGLDSLILAGRAHVSVDDSFEDNEKVTDILTGESVAIKSNQKAYLIPGRFIRGSVRDILHNPVTSADITDNNIPEVDLIDPESDPDIDYASYVDEDHTYKIASKQTIEGESATILYYYFLAFESGKKADDYLKEYISTNEYSLDNTYPFMLEKVALPDPVIKEIMAAGNLMSYNPDAVGIPKVGILPGISNATGITDVDIVNTIYGFELSNLAYRGNGLKATDTVGGLSNLFNKISRLLSLDSDRVYKEEDKVVESTVVLSSTSYLRDWLLLNPNPNVIHYSGDTEFNISQPEGNIILVDGRVDIYNDFTGLMVVNGNVYIDDNVNIEGMILSIDTDASDGVNKIIHGNHVNVTGKLVSMGDIELGSDNTFAASDEILEDIFINQGEVLKYIFRNLDLSVLYTRTDPADSLVDLSSMIYYSNWRRE